MKKNREAKITYELEVQAAAKKYWNTMSTWDKVCDVMSTIFVVACIIVGYITIYMKIAEWAIKAIDWIGEKLHPTKVYKTENEAIRDTDGLDNYSH